MFHLFLSKYLPLDTTFDYIIEQIYEHYKLPQPCSKILIKCLLTKTTKNTTFSFNGRLYKQR